MLFGTSDPLIASFVIAACTGGVAVLSAAEASILFVNKIRMRNLARQGRKSAQLVLSFMENHDRFFATILMGQYLLVILSASYGTTSALMMIPDDRVAFAIPFLLAIFLVIAGAIAPKTFAAQNAEQIALIVARPLSLVMTLIAPIITLLTGASNALIRLTGQPGRMKSPFVTEEELRLMIDMSTSEGILPSDERTLLQNIFEFGDTVASEVMSPRTQLVTLEIDDTVRDAMSLVSTSGYSRFPVYQDDLDKIVGILAIKDLIIALADGEITENDCIERYVKPPHFIPKNKQIDELLTYMREQGFRMVIVSDEFGGTQGIITIENLLAEIIGKIKDEPISSTSDEIEILEEGQMRVPGSISVHDVKERLGIEIPDGPYQTLAGFIFKVMGRIPETGERCQWKQLEIIIEEASGPRIQTVLIRKKKR